jgi:hypothetical protein
VAKTKIELPRVAGWFEDRQAGERVDEVFSVLTTELKYLKSADTTSVGGTPSAQIGSSGLFYQTFEADISTWTKRTDAGTITYPTNGKAGGRAFRSAGGESFYEFPEKIPFDPDRLYRIRTRVRMVTEPASAGESGIFVGVHAYEADGVTLLDRDGGADTTKPHWVAMAESNMNSRVEGSWYTFTGYFSGEGAGEATPSTDADSPRSLEAGARYMSPCFILNSVAGTGVSEIDFISIDVLTEGDESNQVLKDVVDRGAGRVNTGKVVADSCDIPRLSDINVDIGEVTTGLISGETVVIDLDDNLTNVITVRASSTGSVTFSVTKGGTIYPRGNLIVGGGSLLTGDITNIGNFTRRLDVNPASGTSGLQYTPAGGGGVVVEIHDDGTGNGIVTTDFLYVHNDLDVTGDGQIDGDLNVTGTITFGTLSISASDISGTWTNAVLTSDLSLDLLGATVEFIDANTSQIEVEIDGATRYIDLSVI